MPSQTTRGLDSWGSRWTFSLALAGATVGLAGLWRLPPAMGEYGGAAYLLVYLLVLVLVAVPLLMAELGLGRATRRGVTAVLRDNASGTPLARVAPWAGRAALLCALIVLAFYSVVGGMGVAYIFQAALGELDGISPEAAGTLFSSFRESALDLMLWQSVFLLVLVVVSIKGLWSGLQRSLRTVIPILLLLLLVLLIAAFRAGEQAQAGSYLMVFSWEALGWEGALSALSYAFFALGAGTGLALLLGAYMPARASSGVSALGVAGFTLLVAVMLGVVTFSLLFAVQVAPADGFELLFIAVPQAVNALGGGQFLGSLYYMVAVVIAWTSALILMEVPVAWLTEKWGQRRRSAVFAVAMLTWFLAVLISLSFGNWQDSTPLGLTLFEWLNLISSGVIVPLVVVFVAVLCGWFRAPALAAQGSAENYWIRLIWQALLRWLVPVVAMVVVVQQGYESAQISCERAQWSWCDTTADPGVVSPIDMEPLGGTPPP